jgi:signal transduction histidine kinase/tetratricopeptide (TPR) repeat protein
LNLLPKGLLLLLIPLFVQIAFLGIVNLEINRKLNVVNEARGLSEWMTNFQLSKLDFISAVSSYASYLFTGNSDLHSDFELSLLSIRSRLDELARISSSKDEWQKLAHESENVFKTQMSLVRQTDLEKSAGGSDGVKAKLDQLRASLPPLRVLRKDFFELSQIEAARLEKREAEIIRESDETSTLFSWGIVGNIIISVALLHWFKSDVQMRLYNLRLNAKTMIKQDLQFAPVSGHDELSKLNTILARTKEEIDSNFRRRENLTQELVGRLVMPLQQLKIEMLELVRTSRTKLPERALNHAEQFTKNIDRTLQIISLLEQTGKRNCNKMNLEIELCDSDNLIKEAIESLQEFITFKGILVERNTDSIKIPADKPKLVQVLINLLSNAIKFSPKNSTIELRAENENGELARFSVKDAGPGLSSEDQAKVFDRFVQGEAAEKKNGYGMGLAICKMIVEAHGGQIGVSSKENSGSTFWFVLPFKPGLITRETPELGADSTPEENSSVENVSTERVLDHTSNRISVWGKDDFSILGFFCCLFAVEFYFNAHIDQNLRKLESNLKVQKLPQVQGNIADDEKARRMLELAITKFHTSPSKQERLEIIESVNKLIIETDKPEIKFASYVSKADFEIVLGQVKNAIAAQKQAIIYSLQNGQETALTGRCYSLMAMYYFRLWEEFHSSSQNFAKLLEQYAQRSLDLLENETTPASSTEYSSLIHNSLPSSQMSRYLDYCYLGKIYIRRMDKHSLEKAIKYLTTARSLAQTSELGLASAEARANLATALWLSGQKKESFELIHGLEMNVRHDANPENENHALAWHSIAKYYDSINDKRKALESFKFGLDCVEKLKQNKSVLRNLFENSIKQVEQR